MEKIKVSSPAEAWLVATIDILENGEKVGNLQEILNYTIEINPKNRNATFDKIFDQLFRKQFGDDRIDYAASVTFIEPTKNGIIPGRISYEYNGKWFETYWGRMVAWQDQFNQIENVLHILSKGQNVKRCEIMVYDPLRDARNPYKQPCLLSIDLKPRRGKLNLTALFRSQRISKSGFADYTALCNLNRFLAKESNLEEGNVTVIACSCHIAPENQELKNSKELLKKSDALIKSLSRRCKTLVRSFVAKN